MSGKNNFYMKALTIQFAVFLGILFLPFSLKAQQVLLSTGATVDAVANNADILAPTNTPNFTAMDQLINVKSKAFQLKLDAGDLYKLGNNAWKVNLSVRINFLKGTIVLKTIQMDLAINNVNPEKLQIVEYQDLADVTKIQVIKSGFAMASSAYSAATLGSNIRLTGTFINNLGLSTVSKGGTAIIPTSLTATPIASITDVSKVTFSWTPGANRSFATYDLQVLKIEPYQNGDVYVNWDNAATIEVNGTSYDMTLSEGTGFYLWRVRPIGSYYDGARSFWNNIGNWSENVQNGLVSAGTSSPAFYQSGVLPVPNNSSKIVNGAAVSGYYFYYNQFDEDKNFIYGKVLTEGGRQSEKISYANGLNQIQQVQKQLFSFKNIKDNAELSTTNVIARQTVYDYAGRPSLQSLPAPLYRNSLGYTSNFFTPESAPTRTYNASDFDQDINVYNPAKVNGASSIGTYYSNANTHNDYVPDAEGYPYTRNTYFPDPTGKLSRQSMPGVTKRIDDSDNSKNSITFYDGVSQDELDVVFGSEAPLEKTVFKVITVDPNRVTSVKYMAYSGEVLATCLDQTITTVMLPVGNERTINVENVFPAGSALPGDNKSVSRKPLVVTNPTGMTVGINYEITPKTFGITCGNICKTCDYKIEIEISSQDQPLKRGKNLKISFYVDPRLIDAQACNSPLTPIKWGENHFQNVTYTEPSGTESGFGLSNGTEATSIVLKQGSYTIEKRVIVNNNLSDDASKTYYDLARQALIDQSATWTLTQNCCGPLTVDVSNYACGQKPAYCNQSTDGFVASSDPAFINFVNLIVNDVKNEANPAYNLKMTGSLVSTLLASTATEEVGDTDADNFNDAITATNVVNLLTTLNAEFTCQQIGDCYLGASNLLKQNIVQALVPGATPIVPFSKDGANDIVTNATNPSITPPADPKTYDSEFNFIQAMYDCLGYKHGLTGEYFDDYTFFETSSSLDNVKGRTKLVLTRVDPVLNFTWAIANMSSTAALLQKPPFPTSDISKKENPRYFAVRWTGSINIPSGVKQLLITYNDATRVYFDNDLTHPYVNCWGQYGGAGGWGEGTRFNKRYINVGTPVTWAADYICDGTGTNIISTGLHPIKIEYFQSWWDASFVLKWIRTIGGVDVEEVVPSQYLIPANVGCSAYTKIIAHNNYDYTKVPRGGTAVPFDPNALYVFIGNTSAYSSTTGFDEAEMLKPGSQRPKACLGTYFKNVPDFITADQRVELTEYDPLLSTSLQDAIQHVCQCQQKIEPLSANPGLNPMGTMNPGATAAAACFSGCEDKRVMFEEAINNVVIQANIAAGIKTDAPVGYFDETNTTVRKTYANLFGTMDKCCLVDILVENCKKKCGMPNITTYFNYDKYYTELSTGVAVPCTISVAQKEYPHTIINYPFASYKDFFDSKVFEDMVNEDHRNFEIAFSGNVSVAPVQAVNTYTSGTDLAYVENIIPLNVYDALDEALRDRKVTTKVSSSLWQFFNEDEYIVDLGPSDPHKAIKVQVFVEWNPNSTVNKYDDTFIRAQVNLVFNGVIKEQIELTQLPADYFKSDFLSTELHILKIYFDTEHRIHIVPANTILPVYYTKTSNVIASSIESTRKITVNATTTVGEKVYVSLRTPTGIVDLSKAVDMQTTTVGMAQFLAQSINNTISSPDFTASVSGSDVIINVPNNSHALPITSYQLVVSTKNPSDFTIESNWTTTQTLPALLGLYGENKANPESGICPYSYNVFSSAATYGGCTTSTSYIDEASYDHVGDRAGERDAQHGYVLTKTGANGNYEEWYQKSGLIIKSANRVSLATPFSKRYKVNFGSKNDFGADGMVFVIAANTFGPISGKGGQLAYFDQSTSPGTGIANSLGIEFDTYINDYEIDKATHAPTDYGFPGAAFYDKPGAVLPDPALGMCTNNKSSAPDDGGPNCGSCTYCQDTDYDHIAVWDGKMSNRYMTGSPAASIPVVPIKYSSTAKYHALNVEDGEYHDVTFDWSGSPSNILTVYFDGDPRVTIPVPNPSTFFNTSDGKVAFGWIASCNLTNNQSVIPLADPVVGTPSCSLCVRWEKFTPQDIGNVAANLGDYPPRIPVTCESAKAEYIATATQIYLQNCLAAKQTELKDSYTTNCLNKIEDKFSLTYSLGYHHYTLYYYDRAGNLVRTVPPDGVDFLNETTLLDKVKQYRSNPAVNTPVLPAHTQVTTYTYNSLKQLITSVIPDGGKSSFWYNGNGQLVLSQDAQQKATDKYSYTVYDNLGRVVEVSQVSGFAPSFIDEYEQVLPANFSLQGVGTKEQTTTTVYSSSASVSYNGTLPQTNLRNRISYVQTQNMLTNAISKTYYSYDPHGNVQWLLQDLGDIGQKSIRYEYDLVSNNVNKVYFQEGQIDQFIHKYVYDEDNRINAVCTSTDNISWTKEGNYKYYLHGPLARAEIGQDKIQGVDFVYTIEGYMKTINHSSLVDANDPGKDAPGSSTDFLRDEFGMELVYHNADYRRSNSLGAIPIGVNNTTISGSIASGFTNLYNGNIAAWASNTRSAIANGTFSGMNAYGLNIRHFQYDKLNRLKSSSFKDYTGNVLSNVVANKGAETFVYSGNGNITSVNRWDVSGAQIDQLTYNYLKNSTGSVNDAEYVNNRLRDVADNAPSQGSNDLKSGQVVDNYEYDFEGNLINDKQEGVQITWNVYNKVSSVYNSKDPNNIRFIQFDYDAAGKRVRKTVYTNYGTSQQVGTATVYIRDASGNVMSVYKKTLSDNAITWMEAPIYGSSRIGMLRPEKLMVTPAAPPSLTLIKDFEGLDAGVTFNKNAPQGYTGGVANPSIGGVNTTAQCAKLTKGWWGDFVMYDLGQTQIDFTKPLNIDFRKELATNQTIYVWFGNNPVPLYSFNPYNKIYAEYTGTITAAANTWQTVTFPTAVIKDATLDPTTLKYMYIYFDPTNTTAAAYQKNIWYDNIRVGVVSNPCNETVNLSPVSTTLICSLPAKDYTNTTILYNGEAGVSQFTTIGKTAGSHWYNDQSTNHDKEGINQSLSCLAYSRGEDLPTALTMTTATLTTYLPDLSTSKFTLDVFDQSSPTTMTVVAVNNNGTTETEYGTFTAQTTKSTLWQTIEFTPLTVTNSGLKSTVNRLYLFTDRGITYKQDNAAFPILNFESTGAVNNTVSSSAVNQAPTVLANPNTTGINTSAKCTQIVKTANPAYQQYRIDNMDVDPNGNIQIDFYKTNATNQDIVVMFGENPTVDWVNNRYAGIRTEFTKTLTTTNVWSRLTFTAPVIRDNTKAATYMYILFDPNAVVTTLPQTYYIDNVNLTLKNATPTKSQVQRVYLFDNFHVLPSATPQPLRAGGVQLLNDGTAFSNQGIVGRQPQQIISGQTAVAESNDGGYAFSFVNTNVFNADLPKGNHGLTAQFYDLAAGTPPSVVTVPEINAGWMHGTNPFNATQNFRVVYTGSIYIPEIVGGAGSNYTFAVPSVRFGFGSLVIDGTTVWSKASGTVGSLATGAHPYDGTITLTPGFHTITLDVTQTVTNLLSAEIKLLWATPYDQQYSVVNKKYFYNGTLPDTKHTKIDARHGLTTTFYDMNGTTVLNQRTDANININYVNGPVMDGFYLNTVTAAGIGLKGDYYNMSSSPAIPTTLPTGTPNWTRTDATVNFNWGNDAMDPATGINRNNFFVRWTGQIQPRFSENYTFFTTIDDGCRLWIDNQLVIDRWTINAAIEYSGTITLVANRKYDIRLEYFENTGGASIKFEWQSTTSQTREVVPTSQLYASVGNPYRTVHADWKGFLYAPVAGTYSFQHLVNSGDTYTLSLDDFPLTTWTVSGSKQKTSIYLSQGVHRLLSTYNTSNGVATCALEWTLPADNVGGSQLSTIIPSQYLYTVDPTISYLFDQTTGDSGIDLVDVDNRIEASEYNQVIAAPVPDTQADYYLITGKDNFIYYHRVTKKNGKLELVSRNNKLRWNTGTEQDIVAADYALASYVNTSVTANNKLFVAVREAYTGNTEGNYRLAMLQVYPDQANNFVATLINAPASNGGGSGSNAIAGCADLSEIQISPDGKKLAVNIAMVNPSLSTQWFHRFVEYDLTPAGPSFCAFSKHVDLYTETRDVGYYGIERLPKGSILSFDFTPDSKRIFFLVKNRNAIAQWTTTGTFFNKVYSGAVGMHYAYYTVGVAPTINGFAAGADNWISTNSFKASIRRAKDNRMYITRDFRTRDMPTSSTFAASSNVLFLTNVNVDDLAGTFPLSSINYTLGSVLGGSMPLQPFKIGLVPCVKPMVSSTRKVGDRLYEISDHLGNVRATFTDRRLVGVGVGIAAGTPVNPVLDVMSFTDYYAFGMVFREYASKSYRYGFNGQEQDNEIVGSGNIYTAEYWQYDSRLGRRWNIDPIIKKWESPYACFGDNPIALVDPDGKNAKGIPEGNGTSENTSTETTTPLTTHSLRQMAREQGIGGTGVVFNRNVGRAFQSIALQGMPTVLPSSVATTENFLRFPSAQRSLYTGGLVTTVIPDAIKPVTIWKLSPGWNGMWDEKTYLNSHIVEVKAYGGTLRLSTSRYQIQGIMDLARTSPAAVEKRAVVTFITTSNTIIGDDVIRYANIHGISVYQIVAGVNSRGNIVFSNPMRIASPGQRLDLTTLTFDTGEYQLPTVSPQPESPTDPDPENVEN
jgi:RHS repeat-associated protein